MPYHYGSGGMKKKKAKKPKMGKRKR